MSFCFNSHAKPTKPHLHDFLPPVMLHDKGVPAPNSWLVSTLDIFTVRDRNVQIDSLNGALIDDLLRYDGDFLYNIRGLDKLGDHSDENMPINMTVPFHQHNTIGVYQNQVPGLSEVNWNIANPPANTRITSRWTAFSMYG